MIITAMQSAAIRLVGQRPAVFFGASETFENEITDLVGEVAKDIAASHDWQAITRTHTIYGDGATTAFDLPDDYDRMLVRSDVQGAGSWAWGYRHVTDINDFLFQEARSLLPGGWIITGGEMRFTPAPAAGAQASFPYISRNIVRSADTLQAVPEFAADTDAFLLPERLLTLGLVWRWRENKKLDFTGDQEAFAKAISEYAAKDGGARAYRRSSRLVLAGTHPAWPYPLGD